MFDAIAKVRAIRVALTLWVLLSLAVIASVVQASDDYIIGSGDRIKIWVFGEADLSQDILLTDSGVINYPFLGEIEVRGLTLVQIEALIVKGLKGDYLINPNVIVSIVEYRPFFIHGEVGRPGAYPFQPGLTVGKAAALSGGFTERASLAKILVVRDNDTTKTEHIVDVNAPVQPGDIITVKQSFF